MPTLWAFIEMVTSMTVEEIEREVSDLEAFLRHTQDGIDSVLARYGDGIRPSWVSAEIGSDMMQMRQARNQIQKLKEQLKEKSQ
jgi:hypothetical protein